jgi:hypothetical protein
MRGLGGLVMAAALALPPSVASAQSPVPLREIKLGTDLPMAFILFNPSGEVGRTRSSALIRMVSDLVERHTDFKVQLFDANESSGCAGRLGCIVRTVRRDYKREDYVQSAGAVAPFEEHLQKLKKRGDRVPEFLLLMSNITGEEGDRMSITMVDTNAALRLYHEARRDREDWELDTEAEIAQRALLAPARRGPVREEYEARRLFEDYFMNDLRRKLDDVGHWEPYGKVEIEVPVAGAGIELDGVTVGTTQAGLTILVNVRDGEHDLALVHPEYVTWTSKITAKRRDVVRVTPQLDEKASGTSAAIRQAVIFSGLGVAALGGVLTGIAIAGQDGDVVTYCLDAPADDCAGSDFTTLGFSPDAAPTFGDEVNPPGVLFAPLGYSLVAAGATWSLTTLLFGEDGEFPWWQIAAGFVAGGLSYGLSAVID